MAVAEPERGTLAAEMAEALAKLPIYEGEVLAGKYRVSRVIGVGGMGAVVECRHVELGQRVALKFLLPETLKDAECVARFSREARAAVRLKGQHVARVTDVGKLDNGAPYMVMEYLQGKDLAAKLVEHGPYEVGEAVHYILQACEGVAEAHAIGIIHRDIKPRNLFMTKRPNGQPLVKVLDFGIAKLVANNTTFDTALTKISTLIGSPHYIAPEQMTASTVIDVRADIWSIGVCLYEMLSGEVPFNAPTVFELCSKVLDHPPRPVLTLLPDLPPGLVTVIERCLQKKPQDRFADLGELAKALEPYAPVAMRGVVDDICATLANAPGDNEEDTAHYQVSSGFAAPPSLRPPIDPLARSLSDPPPASRSTATDPRIRFDSKRTVTTPQPTGTRANHGPRALYVFASVALIAAIAYAIYVRAIEQRSSAAQATDSSVSSRAVVAASAPAAEGTLPSTHASTGLATTSAPMGAGEVVAPTPLPSASSPSSTPGPIPAPPTTISGSSMASAPDAAASSTSRPRHRAAPVAPVETSDNPYETNVKEPAPAPR